MRSWISNYDFYMTCELWSNYAIKFHTWGFLEDYLAGPLIIIDTVVTIQAGSVIISRISYGILYYILQ